MLTTLASNAVVAIPAPGILIDIGGHWLNIACEGYGTPTVVLDVGLGGNALEWHAVTSEVIH